MNLLVVGGGRIGVPIALAAHSAGHTITCLVRSVESEAKARVRMGSASVNVEACIEQSSLKNVDLIVLAVRSENLHDLKWVRGVPEFVPVASVMAGLSANELRDVVDDRPLVQFMCSAAVQFPDSVRCYSDDGAHEAIDRLRDALPGSRWVSVSAEKFERFCTVFIAAPVVCSVLAEFERSLDFQIDGEERAVLLDAVHEARRLIECNSDNPALAFDSAATPGGLSRDYYRRIFGRECADE